MVSTLGLYPHKFIKSEFVILGDSVYTQGQTWSFEASNSKIFLLAFLINAITFR
jgi:hypothetical protein